MKLQRVLCSLGLHKFRTIEMTDCFSTTYVDKNWGPIKHMVWYQMCSCCGKRRLKDTVKKDTLSERHNGVEYARIAWIEHGKMYLGNGDTKPFLPPKPKKTADLVVFKGGKE